MQIGRRSVLRFSACALAATAMPVRWALGAGEIKSLRLIEPLGKPSVTWTVLDLLRPALAQYLKCAVVGQTIPGHDGLDAIHAVLEQHDGETRLFGTGVMAT